MSVYKYVGPGSYLLLPNVVCLSIEQHEGIDPGSACFRYVMDPRTGGPYTVEQALSTAYTGSLIVDVGDRLLVAAQRPDGQSEWIFDGYPVGFGGHIAGRAEGVALHAIGVAKRVYDRTIDGMIMRDAADPMNGDDVQTGRVVRFNPKGRANATPKDGDSGTGTGEDDRKYPVFLDELLPQPPPEADRDEPWQRHWTLAMAVRYLCYTCNGETFVKNPPGGRLDAVLVTREPIGGMAIDPDDPSTYTAKPIKAPDVPLKGERWPVAVRKLTEDYGIGMRFQLTTVGGDPATELQFFWTQQGPVKSIYLDQRTADFDGARNNVGQADMERDISGVVNEVTVEGGLKVYEASFLLECGFPSASTDADEINLKLFRDGDPAFATTDNYDKYRLWVFDECGEGHYRPATVTKLTDVPDLAPLFGDDEYVNRRRPGKGDLFTAAEVGKQLKWRVSLSKDYAGPLPPCLWDGTGHWQHVPGGVQLLKDRLGIRLTVDDVNKWNVGKPPDADPQTKSEIVKVVQCIAAPDAENPKFFVMLTCVIEGDQVVSATAPRTGSSPVPWDIEERVDARDRLFLKTIAYPSEFNKASDGILAPIPFYDDTPFLEAEGIAVRQTREAGVFEAEVVIPYFTRYYEVGDRIDKIQGRDLGFRTDGGGGGIAPVYPMVTSVRQDLANGQHTILTLSDQGMSHTQRRRRPTTKARQYARQGHTNERGDFEAWIDRRSAKGPDTRGFEEFVG